LRKPLRCLAGAVLANALIFTGVAAPAMAQEVETSTETTVTSTTEPPKTTSTTTSEPTSTSSESSQPQPTTTTTTGSETSTSGSETSTVTTTAPTQTSQSSESSTTTQPTTPEPPVEEPPYVDDMAWGIDIDPEKGLGLLLIACAAGEPSNVHSPDFEILEGPHQDEVDGRYWYYFVQLRPGVTFDDNEVTGNWECGGQQPGGGGAPVAPVSGSGSADEWQDSNDGDAQVKFAPKGGVETGFGGIARG
jgi:hypothetical protein